MKKRLLSISLLLALVLALLPTAALADDTTADAPVAGGVYYSSVPGVNKQEINTSELPDPELHYVPFVYTGSIHAYRWENETQKTEAYDHRLLVAVYWVYGVTALFPKDPQDEIFGDYYGRAYTHNGVCYTARVPSMTGEQNEWDKILGLPDVNRNLQDRDQPVIGQDLITEEVRLGRDVEGVSKGEYAEGDTRLRYRMILEVPKDTELRVVTLDLNGGTLGEESSIQILVNAEESFSAPTAAGLSWPEEETEGKTLRWQDSDGWEYEPEKTPVASTVTSLKAVWSSEEINIKPEEPEEPEKPQWSSLLPVISGSLQFASGDDNPFKDVRAIDWFYDEVLYAYRNGLVSGTAHDKFSPGETFTRGMLLTILARADGVRTSGTPWYQAGCDWASQNGISDGKNPGEAITREEFAQILYRYAQYRGNHTLGENDISQFADAEDVSEDALHAVRWAVAETILRGDDYQLNPQGFTTRAEAAAMLYRFFN